MKKVLTFLLLCSPLMAQSWSGIVDQARATDWTKAGIPGGVPTTWANCVTSQCNTLFGGTVTAASINAAISSAPAQTVVRIPAGTFSLSSCISSSKSNFILRGAGPKSTTLTETGGNLMFGGSSGCGLGGQPGLSATNWTGGFTRGSTVITVASTSGLSAGMQVGLDQLNDTSIVFTAGAEGTLPGVNRNGLSWGGSVARAQHQTSDIKAVCTGNNIPAGFGCTGSNQLAIDPPVQWTAQSGLSPQVYWWSPASSQWVGIENLKINCNQNDFCITFQWASYNWVKNVEIDNGLHSEIRCAFCFRSEFRDNYLSENAGGGGPTQYGIEIADSSFVKVENNILFNITSAILPDTSVGIVLGYNYAQNIIADNQFADFEAHAVHNFLHLWEGNVVNGLAVDNVWGSHSQTTMFRNRSSGKAPNKTNFRIGLSLPAHQRYMNLVGNVMGTSGYHTVYQKDDTNQNGTDNFVWEIGFWHRWDFEQTPYDTVTKTSLFRWGNWDSANNANRFVSSEVPTTDPTFPNSVPSSQALPPSFYTGITSAKPSCGTGLSFWKNPSSGACPPYPPIGPDVTGGNIANAGGHAYKIPAQLCYEATSKDASGYMTAYDANSCYSLDSASSGSPIANLSPSTLNLGLLVIGHQSSTQQITISNTGDASMSITAMSATGDFSISSNDCGTLPVTLAIGGSCHANIAFTPTQAGSRTGVFSITDNATGSPHTVSLSGSGQFQTAPATGLFATISKNQGGLNETARP